MVTLIEKDGAFEVYGTGGQLIGTVEPGMELGEGRKTNWYWNSSDNFDGFEPTLAQAIEVLTGYCPTGGVAIK